MRTYKTDFATYAYQSTEEIVALFNSDIQKGLSSEQVKQNKTVYGTNSLALKQTYWWHILWNQCSSIFVLIFMGLGILSLALGELTNALIIFTCISINLIFGFYQEYSTSKAISLLKKYLISYVKVRRNGTTITIPSKDIVVGDLIVLGSGDRLFADIRIVQDNNLTIDESALTGESTPVQKTVSIAITHTPLDIYSAHNIGFTGTTITNGTGLGIVFAIGKNTTLGTIVDPAKEAIRESSIVTSTQHLGLFLIKLIILTLCCILAAHLLTKGPTNYIKLLIFTTALAISVIPEALPIVVTFCLSSGAAALAKKNVLVKRLSAIEDLGTVEVLCTDKTGTLTENKVTIANTLTIPPYNVLVEAALASDFIDKSKHKGAASKGFDAAIYNSLSAEELKLLESYERIQELAYDPERRLNSALVRDKQSQWKLIVRGMQEDVIPLCQPTEQDTINSWIKQEQKQGHRITAIAIRAIPSNQINQADTTAQNVLPDLAQYEHDLLLVGLLAFKDPLKKTTKEAIVKSKKLGLKIKILSGDSEAVCYSIAQQLDLITDQCAVITGAYLDSLSEDQQIKAVNSCSIFARCLPAHKLHIVQLLQRTYTVAYLGDGINDIPALKIAHVSLAVQEAVDITRDTVDIILLEKSLLVIIDGIEEGRKIVANTLKYIKTTLSNNFGNLYAIAITSLFIDYLPILPIHILLINLLSDFPLLAISTDTVDDNALRNPQHFSTNRILSFVITIGLVGNLFDIITFITFHKMPPQTVQMAWYLENMFTAIVLIYSTRTSSIFFKAKRPSTPLLALSCVALLMATLPFYTQIGHRILILPPLSNTHLLWVIGITIAYFITVEIVKYCYYVIIEKIYPADNA